MYDNRDRRAKRRQRLCCASHAQGRALMCGQRPSHAHIRLPCNFDSPCRSNHFSGNRAGHGISTSRLTDHRTPDCSPTSFFKAFFHQLKVSQLIALNILVILPTVSGVVGLQRAQRSLTFVQGVNIRRIESSDCSGFTVIGVLLRRKRAVERDG